MDKASQIRLVKGWLKSGLEEDAVYKRCIEDCCTPQLARELIDAAKRQLKEDGVNRYWLK